MSFYIKDGDSWISDYGNTWICFDTHPHNAIPFERYGEADAVCQSLAYLADAALEVVQIREALRS